MTTPDPVTDVWELLWTAACDYRDANPPPHNSVARLIDALMPIVQSYGNAREEAGRQSVGLGDFVVTHCDEHSESGYTWDDQ